MRERGGGGRGGERERERERERETGERVSEKKRECVYITNLSSCFSTCIVCP